MNLLVVLNICYGLSSSSSIYFCEDRVRIVDEIIKISNDFDGAIVVNDSHLNEDNEFNYVPPHLLSSDISHDEKLLNPVFNCLQPKQKRWKTFGTKNKFSAKDFVPDFSSFDEVVVCGFVFSLDVLPTILDMCQEHPNVKSCLRCTYDPKEDLFEKMSSYIRWIGIGDIDD